MRLPAKEYYSLKEVADQWGCTISDLLHYAEIGMLEICVYIDSGKYEVHRSGQKAQNIKKVYKEYMLGDSCPIPLRKFRICVYNDREKYERAQQEAYNIKKEYVPGDSYPILLRSEGWRNMRMQGHLQGDLVIIMHSQEGAYIAPVKRDYAISELIVTHKEKLRFEKECAPIKTQMGTTERENLLRLIGAFIEIHYQGNDYRKKNSLPNATAISKKFHGWLIDNDFSDKGMSDKSFRNLIPEAYHLIMENKTQEKIEEYTYAEDKPNKLKKIPST